MNVLVTGGDGDAAQAIKRELANYQDYSVYTPGKHELDVTAMTSVEDYVADMKPDILINNAGYIHPLSIYEQDESHNLHTFSVNLQGTFNCSSVVLANNPQALIINIGSSAGIKARANWSAYSASKAGVIMAAQCWADEGVRAICLSPGRMQTKMRKRLYPDEDQNTLLDPQDFAKVVVKKIKGHYENGEHVQVNKDNVDEFLA